MSNLAWILLILLIIGALPFFVYFLSYMQMKAWLDAMFHNFKPNKSKQNGKEEKK